MPFSARWLCLLLACSALLRAQERPLDHAFEPYFDSLDARTFIDAMPPRVELPAGRPVTAEQLLAAPPRFTEQRENLFHLDFDSYNLEANPARLLYLQRETIDLAPDDDGGQALRIRNDDPTTIAGITRPLDPNRLAGRLVELSVRVKVEQPYLQPPEPQSWYRPTIQIRWERPHPGREERLAGEVVREWHTIFETIGGFQGPPEFMPDNRFHTYRGRLYAPDDLTAATLQIVVQRSVASMVVDDIALSVVETRQDRFFAASARGEGNLMGPGSSFELGLSHGAVTVERALSPLAGGPAGRDFGVYEISEGAAPDGQRALSIRCPAGRAAALEWPWVGLEAGQPYTLSVWLKSTAPSASVVFGVADVQWRLLGSPVTIGDRWRRYAATFTPPQTHQQAFWPWVTINGGKSDTTVQIDAIQLERGTSPSAFKPALDLALTSDGESPAGPGHRTFQPLDEPVRITARFLHRGAKPRTVRLRAVLESHDGRLFRALTEAPFELELPPSEPVEIPLHELPLPRGLYRFWLLATDTATGSETRAERIVAVYEPTATRRFGFHEGPVSDARLAGAASLAQVVGAGAIDTAGTPTADWREHWLGDLNYDWSLLDRYLTSWHNAGFEVIHTVGPRLESWPPWVIEQYGAQFLPTAAEQKVILPPDKIWTTYLRELATRYAEQVDGWQILARPDLTLTPAEYLRLLRLADGALAPLAPETPLLGPGLARIDSALPGGFLDHLIELGGLDHLDVVTTALDPSYPERLDAARDHLRKLKQQHGLRLWDLGHRYAEPALLTDRLNPRGEVDRVYQSFSDQSYDAAAFYARHELLLAAAGFERSFVSGSIADLEYLHAPVGPMIESNGAPRSSLAALAVIAEEIGDAPSLGEWRWRFVPEGPPAAYDYGRDHGVRAVAFRTGDDRCLLAIWTYQRDATVTLELPLPGSTRLFVTTGGEVSPPADGRLQVTMSPLYLADLPLATLARLAELDFGGVTPEVVPPPAG